MQTSVSAGRIAKALGLVLAGITGITVTAAGLSVNAHARELSQIIEDQVKDGAPPWRDDVAAWMFYQRAQPFAWPQTERGNAAVLLFPDGIGSRAVSCPLFYPQKAEAPIWQSNREQWTEAARCENLETFRIASRKDRFDLLDPLVRREASPEALMNSADARGILSGIGALVSSARSHWEKGAPLEAEEELRALIGLGVLLVRDSPDLQLMQYGHLAIDVGLSYLVILKQEAGLEGEVAEIEALIGSLPSREGCIGLMKTEMPFTATLPAGIAAVAAVAEEGRLPLAVRLNALLGISLGHLYNPREFVSGPSDDRVRTAAELGRDPALRIWWEDTSTFKPPLSWRLGMLRDFVL